jgi:hypothetical protein
MRARGGTGRTVPASAWHAQPLQVLSPQSRSRRAARLSVMREPAAPGPRRDVPGKPPPERSSALSRSGRVCCYVARAPLEFAGYDPAWPQLSRQAIAELVAALPGLFSTIEHVGSTSVPGLAAKPIIDLMAATGDLDGSARERVTCTCWGMGFTTPGCRAGFCTSAALPAPGRTICMLSKPVPCRPGIGCCWVTICAATLTTPPGTAHSRDGSPRCMTMAATTPGQRPNSSRNSPTRRGPSAGSRRRQCERSEQ